MLSFPHLEVTMLKSGLVEFEQQDGAGDAYSVWVNPIQIRAVAEQLGLLESSDSRAAHRIATLERRLRKLQERIGHLAWYLGNCSDHEHANIDWETDYARATAEIGEEFCADLGDSAGWATPAEAGHEKAPASPVAASAPAADASRDETRDAVTVGVTDQSSRATKQSPSATTSAGTAPGPHRAGTVPAPDSAAPDQGALELQP